MLVQSKKSGEVVGHLAIHDSGGSFVEIMSMAGVEFSVEGMGYHPTVMPECMTLPVEVISINRRRSKTDLRMPLELTGSVPREWLECVPCKHIMQESLSSCDVIDIWQFRAVAVDEDQMEKIFDMDAFHPF